MNDELKHPYWDQYLQLVSYKATFNTSDGKRSIRKLAEQASFTPQDMLKLNFLFTCPGIQFRFVIRLFFCVLRERFAYSVLSPEVLEIIATLSPLVELGAGNGYVAWLLQQMGADVVAFDAYPVEEGRNWFFNTRFGFPARGAHSWTIIERGTAQVLTGFPDRTLLLCWPPKNEMAFDSLRYFPGERVAIVLEKSCCASKAFFRELQQNWIIEYSTQTGSWSPCHVETLEIYSRKTKHDRSMKVDVR